MIRNIFTKVSRQSISINIRSITISIPLIIQKDKPIVFKPKLLSQINDRNHRRIIISNLPPDVEYNSVKHFISSIAPVNRLRISYDSKRQKVQSCKFYLLICLLFINILYGLGVVEFKDSQSVDLVIKTLHDLKFHNILLQAKRWIIKKDFISYDTDAIEVSKPSESLREITDYRIHVSNLPNICQFNHQDFGNYFQKSIGNVESYELYFNEFGCFRQNGYVQFTNKQAMQIALKKMNNRNFMGNQIIVKRFESPLKNQNRRQYCTTCHSKNQINKVIIRYFNVNRGYESDDNIFDNVDWDDIIRDSKAFDLMYSKNRRLRTLCIDNLPSNTNHRVLRQYINNNFIKYWQDNYSYTKYDDVVSATYVNYNIQPEKGMQGKKVKEMTLLFISSFILIAVIEFKIKSHAQVAASLLNNKVIRDHTIKVRLFEEMYIQSLKSNSDKQDISSQRYFGILIKNFNYSIVSIHLILLFNFEELLNLSYIGSKLFKKDS